MYDVVLFDFDGTLVNTNDLIVEALQAAANLANGKDLSNKELDHILGRPLQEQMEIIHQGRADELVAYYRQYYRQRRDDMTQIFDGVTTMLSTLKDAGVRMGVVSNKGTSGIRHGIDLFDLDAYFEVALSSEDVLEKKPHPEGIYKALEQMKSQDQRVLFVGDSGHDIECGQRAEIDTALVGWTILDKDRLLTLNPTYLAESVDQLTEFILK